MLIELGSVIVYTLQSPFGVRQKQYYWKDKKTQKMHGPFPSLHHSLSNFRDVRNELKKKNTRMNTTIYCDFQSKKRLVSEKIPRDS